MLNHVCFSAKMPSVNMSGSFMKRGPMTKANHVIDQSAAENAQGFLGMVRTGLERYGFLGALGRFILMQGELRRFAATPQDSTFDSAFRKDLLKKFQKIDRNVICAHSPFQFVLMADYILSLPVKGPMVECGCYKGGSTAKLSLLAKATGRKLYVFDSFAGLPEPEKQAEALVPTHDGEFRSEFHKGDYMGGLEEVKDNIARYGCLDICEFFPGFFDQSMMDFKADVAFVFIDVDLVSSARSCLKHLWPLLLPGGYFFTHEANLPEYLYGILDEAWWRENLNTTPPLMFGAGSGLSNLAECIAYMKKA